jgi:hypothetical protein
MDYETSGNLNEFKIRCIILCCLSYIKGKRAVVFHRGLTNKLSFLYVSKPLNPLPTLIDDLYHNYGIPTSPEGHKHHRPGWVNIECPHCQGDGYHLGFNTQEAYFYCFRCGSHPVNVTLMKLLQVSYNQAEELSKTYKLSKKRQSIQTPTFNPGVVKIKKKGFKFPSDITELQKPHKKYLLKRNFDPDYLVKTWDVKATSPFSKLDGIDYRYRILIPILWDDKPVTFQARDYTGKQEIKYKACPEEREAVHHKHILYGHPSLWQKRRGILVEGVFDVWRLRQSACCTFGTGYTTEQVRLMIKLFDELFILFDPEPIAQKTARGLQQELAFWGVKAHIYTDISTDPGDMSDEDATYLLKEFKML